MIRRIIYVSLAIGAVGPVLLIPVAIWLDAHPHSLTTSMQWEIAFRWLWPTSPMLMTGRAPQILSLSYVAIMTWAALSNVLLFGLLGSAVVGLVVVARTLSRPRRRGADKN